jgi:F-type H+-transporting ATPase subunit b
MTDRYKKHKHPAARTYKLLLSIVILLFSLFIMTARAEETEQSGAHGEGEQATHFKWSLFMGQVLNSSILFGGLVFLLRKPLLKYLNEKSKNVEVDLETNEEGLLNTINTFSITMNRFSFIKKDESRLKEKARQSAREKQIDIDIRQRLEIHKIEDLKIKKVNRQFESSFREVLKEIAEPAVEQSKQKMLAELDDRLHEKIILENIELIGEINERR